MTRPRVVPRDARVPLVPRVKVWLEAGESYAFGLGISEVLEAIDRTGSIKAAAAEVGKSYRHVWGRLKRAEAVLGRQLVETQVGGKDAQRSCLTTEARGLVRDFSRLRRRVIALVQRECSRSFHWPTAPPSA